MAIISTLRLDGRFAQGRGRTRPGEDVYGKADLLVRSDDAPSALGDFHYRVKEIKNAGKLKEYHQLQAAAYAWILGTIQDYSAESFDIVLRGTA